MVPVIVNAILNEHQVVVDIVAFVARGDFPRSRLGEKQRGKILASWVTRKMRTIAQFSIRDPDGADSQITEVPEERVGHRNVRHGSTTLQGSEPPPSAGLSATEEEGNFSVLPKMEFDLPDSAYEDSIVEFPPSAPGPGRPSLDIPTNQQGAYLDQHLHHGAPEATQFDPDQTPLAERPAFDYAPYETASSYEGAHQPLSHTVSESTTQAHLSAAVAGDYNTLPSQQRGSGAASTGYVAYNSSHGRQAGASVPGNPSHSDLGHSREPSGSYSERNFSGPGYIREPSMGGGGGGVAGRGSGGLRVANAGPQ
jgi:hypothetical protein